MLVPPQENAKRAGRSAGRDFPIAVQLRLNDAQAMAIDEFRRTQSDLPSRSEAIRRLVERALNGGGEDAEGAN